MQIEITLINVYNRTSNSNSIIQHFLIVKLELISRVFSNKNQGNYKKFKLYLNNNYLKVIKVKFEMEAPPLSEEELNEIYNWVDEIPLSRPKKNISRDFADGVLVAEIVANFIPRLVELHNYSAANGVQ